MARNSSIRGRLGGSRLFCIGREFRHLAVPNLQANEYTPSSYESKKKGLHNSGVLAGYMRTPKRIKSTTDQYDVDFALFFFMIF